jgi:cytochrome bd-type quinol oxidase subunit 2
MALEPKLALRDLKLVAILFIIFGIWSAVETAIKILDALLNGPINIVFSLGVLQIPIGLGLLSLKYRWYRWATIYLAIYFVILAIGTVILIFVGIWTVFTPHWDKNTLGVTIETSMTVEKFGWKDMVILLVDIIVLMSMLWMYRVLTKPSTRELFNADKGIVSLKLSD